MLNPATAFREALKLHQAGSWDAAEESYLNILREHPTHFDSLHHWGIIHLQRKQYLAAETLIARALQLQPRSPAAHFNLGTIYFRQGRYQPALAAYDQALALQPTHADTLRQHAETLRKLQAEEQTSNRAEMLPTVEDYLRQAEVLRLLGSYAEAFTPLEQALRLAPHDAELYALQGKIYEEQNAWPAALEAYDRAVELKPDFGAIYAERGLLLLASGRQEEALASLEQGVLLEPQNLGARWNRGIYHLLMGNWEAGWQDYDARFGRDGVARMRQHLPWPLWNGAPSGAAKLFLYAEQGIGDEIMFASCLPELSARGICATYATDPRLIPLLARSFPEHLFISRQQLTSAAELAKLEPLDFQLPIGSLPRFFRRGAGDFPTAKSFLQADATLRQSWQTQLAELGPQLNIGISWRGGGEPLTKRQRSISLREWQQLFRIPGIRWIDLQYGETTAERQAAATELGVEIVHWDELDPLRDLDSFAACVSALDLVISVDNSTVHLAGALGIPTWVALPKLPDWRWQLEREDSPWYRSLRLFRQSQPGEWGAVFARLADALIAFQEQYRPSNA